MSKIDKRKCKVTKENKGEGCLPKKLKLIEKRLFDGEKGINFDQLSELSEDTHTQEKTLIAILDYDCIFLSHVVHHPNLSSKLFGKLIDAIEADSIRGNEFNSICGYEPNIVAILNKFNIVGILNSKKVSEENLIAIANLMQKHIEYFIDEDSAEYNIYKDIIQKLQNHTKASEEIHKMVKCIEKNRNGIIEVRKVKKLMHEIAENFESYKFKLHNYKNGKENVSKEEVENSLEEFAKSVETIAKSVNDLEKNILEEIESSITKKINPSIMQAITDLIDKEKISKEAIISLSRASMSMTVAVLENQKAPREVINDATKDKHWWVALRAAQHSEISVESLERLANHPDLDVVKAVKDNPKTPEAIRKEIDKRDLDKPQRILVVEDNPKHLKDVKEYIEQLKGVEVDFATNLEEANKLLDSNHYKAAVSDIFFPDKEGGDPDNPKNAGSISMKFNDLGIHHVFCTSTHHHGKKQSEVEIHGKIYNEKFVNGAILESDERDLQDIHYGETDEKSWQAAFRTLFWGQEALKKPNMGIDFLGDLHIRHYDYGSTGEDFEKASEHKEIQEVFSRYNV